MNPTKTGVELRCSGRGKKSLKISKELSELWYLQTLLVPIKTP
jgi:hypothetical protein